MTHLIIDQKRSENHEKKKRKKKIIEELLSSLKKGNNEFDLQLNKISKKTISSEDAISIIKRYKKILKR